MFDTIDELAFLRFETLSAIEVAAAEEQQILENAPLSDRLAACRLSSNRNHKHTVLSAPATIEALSNLYEAMYEARMEGECNCWFFNTTCNHCEPETEHEAKCRELEGR